MCLLLPESITYTGTPPPLGRTSRPVAARSSNGLPVGSQPSGVGTRESHERPSPSNVAALGTWRFQPERTRYTLPSRFASREPSAVHPPIGCATERDARTGGWTE